ncbi:SRPBCC domain-containing protein [Cyclobacterium plantarum]|uniref:SRPBCC domain-containing protein n=1 Tax=Cyclobacterium plantarum TaxID=2716263 RepID=UPI003F70307F
MKKEIGKTKSVGYQFGIQKTFEVKFSDLWEFIFHGKGLQIWLGELSADLEVKKPFHTSTGITGVVNVFKEYSHLRGTWKKADWPNTSVIQVRVISKSCNKTLLSFHQEKLLDSAQRKEMKHFWNDKINNIQEALRSQLQHEY